MTMQAIKNSKYLKDNFTIDKVTEFIKIIDFIGTAKLTKIQAHITNHNGSLASFRLSDFYEQTPENDDKNFLTRKVMAVDNLLDKTKNTNMRRVVLVHPDSSTLVVLEQTALEKYESDLHQMRSIFKEGLERLNLIEEKVKGGLFLTGAEEQYIQKLLQFAITLKESTTTEKR